MAKDFTQSHVQAGADANLTNNVGDTPLHKAAFTGRQVRYINVPFILLVLKQCLWISYKNFTVLDFFFFGECKLNCKSKRYF